ncbi:tetratricopeptide repeat protein [Pedobacter cryoconitis]|uniref:Tetratricopeptide (TPR) repeat protein n=1 Tax=Pedobacter cryoconitis TaxID=188932 RepID=A0A7X0J2M2_9SPHI|nr:tetratricopeptide repeat protein [Pedobacter cryoconitis]MBB6499930.1 tetratricopeptide (TPR) repeat protein [Pedobacter cryoconitis]
MKIKSLLILFLFFSLKLNAQVTVDNAWSKFLQNDRQTSRNLFLQLAKNPKTLDDANIGLCLISEMDRPDKEAFTYLDKFYTTSKTPEPYLFALWGSPANYSGYRKSPEQMTFYNSLSQRKDIDGTLSAMALSLAGKHYQQNKNYEMARKAYGQIGELENWLITGEYENISTSGFDKSYDVINHPELNANFSGKRNRQFGWREVPYTRLDKWFDFSYYNSYKNSIQFAQTFVKSPANMTAELRTGVSGSIKVWVNDQLILSEAEERNNDLDSYINSIKLNEGYNRILIQVGESYAGRSNFMIRLTDEKGHPLTNITTSSSPQNYTKETAYVSTQIKPAAFNYFETELEKHPDNYLNQLMLARLYLRQGNIFECRSLLEKLKQQFPKSTYLNTMLIELFSKAGNRTGIETLQEAIKANDPESSYALELTYNECLNQKDYNKATATIAKLEKIYGEADDIYLKKITVAGKLKNQQEVISLGDKSYPLFPNSADIVGIKYGIEKEIRKNPNAIEIVEKYVAGNDDYSSAKYLAQLYFDKGESEKGLTIYKDEIKNDPISFGVYTDLAAQYYKLQQYDSAEKVYLQALQIDPNHADTYNSMGQLYSAAKQKAKSIEAYNKTLQISPNNYDAIQSLRRLQDKKAVFDYFAQPDVKAIIGAAPKASDYPDDQVLVLDREVQKVVYENGGSEEKHFNITKALTQKGLESLTEYTIPYNSDQNFNVEVAEVIKANGTKVPAEQNENRIVFTNLEVGDAINLRYTIENYSDGQMASHFSDSFYFSYGLSYVNKKYALLIHHDKPFKYVFSQSPIAPVKSKKDEFDLYVWQQGNQKALLYEDKMPPSEDVVNKLYISSIPSWQFVADWYNNIATAKARTSYEVKSVVRDLFANQKDLDQLTKIKMIYSYITRNIAYSSVPFRQNGVIPQNPATVINTRIGDCKDVSTLFVTMCKEAGIDATLALVSTRDNGQNTLPLPSIDFNHCIAKTTINNQDYWVELTSGNLPFNTFNNGFINSNVLPIDKKSNELIKFNPTIRGRNTLTYQTVVKIENADMLVTETNQNTGSAVSYLRSVFTDLSNKDQLKKMKEQLSSSYPENEVYKLSFTNLDAKKARSDTLGTASSYKLINVSKPVAGMMIFSLPWSTKVSAANLQVLPERKFGIDLTQIFVMDESKQQLILELPADKSLVQLPKDIHISNEFIDFSLESQQIGNKISLKRNFVLKSDLVPLDKVKAFNTFYKQIAEADEQQLAMK